MSAQVKEPRTPNAFADLGIARISAIAAVIVVASALQSTVLSYATVLGVIPQVVLVVVLSLAFTDGARVGLVCGFFAGLLQDLQLPQGSIVGLYALVYTLVAYGVGQIREFTPAESVWTPVFAVAAATAVVEASYATLAIMLGQEWVSIGFTAKVIGLVVLYNTLLTPLVFPLVRKVADRFRPERVYHW
jgi:rod shape-determining protein MreD